MLTYEDDCRIMTDEDMAIAKKLSRFENEAGVLEGRLMACMRLLLAHIEGITDGAVTLVDRLSTKRDPPRNDMTDVFDEGYEECKKDALEALRKGLK